MQQHTPEPWKFVRQDKRFDGSQIIGTDGENILFDQYGPDGSTTDANAARIVACVNACAGIPNEYLQNAAHNTRRIIANGQRMNQLLRAVLKSGALAPHSNLYREIETYIHGTSNTSENGEANQVAADNS